ncbi:MAG TPA: rhomboid family intramembrane serine protease [Cyclobacteriaceae bacterium]|nr:rhomboid family intramembrane serine protease [Cyclobacteriaceae bacterium]
MFDEFKSAFQRSNNAHVQLIIINVVIFIVIGVISVVGEISGNTVFSDFIYNQFTIPPTIAEYLSRPWTLITYMFAHSRWDIFHILFNMLVFYWFGRLFVEYLGSAKLTALYILGGLAGGIFYLLMFNTVPFYMERSGFSGMVGASAAIYAIVVATAALLPNYTFFLLFFGPVRIKYIAGFYVVISFLGTTQSNAGGNLAHLGGALMGFIYLKQLQAGINWGSWITATLEWMQDLFKSKPKVKVTYRSEEKATKKAGKVPGSKASQAEIDAILDKISDRGYESLTKEEKEKLFNASKK